MFEYPFSNRIFLLKLRSKFYLNKDATDVCHFLNSD